jgi:hypothetical protein
VTKKSVITIYSPEETARKVAEWRAAGLLPPRGKSREWVKPEDKRTVTTQAAVELPPCVSLGEVIHEEPCTCGASKRIPVYQCNNPENAKKSGAAGLCVPLKTKLASIKDKDARQSLMCCETCQLRCAASPSEASQNPSPLQSLPAPQEEQGPAG